MIMGRVVHITKKWLGSALLLLGAVECFAAAAPSSISQLALYQGADREKILIGRHQRTIEVFRPFETTRTSYAGRKLTDVRQLLSFQWLTKEGESQVATSEGPVVGTPIIG